MVGTRYPEAEKPYFWNTKQFIDVILENNNVFVYPRGLQPFFYGRANLKYALASWVKIVFKLLVRNE